MIKFLASYDEKDIFNADETGLFLKCLPDKTLIFENENYFGVSHNKRRITVMVGANMCGTEKLKLLVIGMSRNQRCFSGEKRIYGDIQKQQKGLDDK